MAASPKILVVDDEHINLEFFNVMLSRLGYTVATAADGEEALDQILSERPDLVLLDNILPGRTGWEVTRLVKRDPEYAEVADTPIIMFSAMDDVQDKVEGFELGIEDYITKPFNFSEVLARIQAILRQRELWKQVVQRERRLALVESLNNSLVYFTKHIKTPVQSMLESARSLQATDSAASAAFAQTVATELSNVLETVHRLDDEVHELQAQGDELKASELSLEDIEARFDAKSKFAARSPRRGSL